jgi:CRP/FNR family transcriptional regulator
MNGTTSTSQIRPISSCRCGAYEPNPIEVLMHQMLHNGSEYSILMAKRTFRRGQHLYRPGANGKHVYSINRGTFKTYRIGDDGRERILGFHSEGMLLGLDSLAGRQTHCGAIALDTTVICQIPITAIMAAADKSKQLRQRLFEQFDDEIDRLGTRLSLRTLPAPQRFAHFILSIAGNSASVTMPMTNKEISNYLNLVPETVSRLLAKFQQRDWLTIEGREIQILDRAALLTQSAVADAPSEHPKFVGSVVCECSPGP